MTILALVFAVIGIPLALLLGSCNVSLAKYNKENYPPPKGRIGALLMNLALCGLLTIGIMSIIGVFVIFYFNS